MSTTTSTCDNSENPVLALSKLPLQYPPYDKIKTEHFKPAFLAAMEEHSKQIDAIANNTEEATFENTILALENSGLALQRVNKVFQILVSSNTNDDIQKLDEEMSPKLVAHKNSIFMNEALFQRVHELFAARNSSIQDDESHRLLWRYHTDFVRTGAQLTAAEDKTKFKQLSEEIASLETKFQQNVLAEVNECAVWFDNEAELEGFSAEQLAAAKEAADAAFAKEKEKQQGNGNSGEEIKKKGNFLVKLKNTTQQPDLADLKKPETRQKIFTASLARNSRGGPNDNREIIINIARKRAERAKLLGFPSHAAYVLADEMVGTPEKALELLVRLAKPALEAAKKEAEELSAFAGRPITPADWSFYSEQLRAQKYSFDTATLKPYFELSRIVNDGIFFTAKELYGIEFVQRSDLPTYHPLVQVYDVKDIATGAPVGLFITDWYARDSKRGGAWMTDTTSQARMHNNQLPVVYNNANAPVPAAGQKNTLIDLDMLTTIFHEFGHGLHGLLSNVKYERLSGTDVSRDAVECPSQFHETWALHPDVLPRYAKHCETGEPLPQALVDKLRAAERFNVGFSTLEYLQVCLFDLQLHSLPLEQIPKPEELNEWAMNTLKKFEVHFPLIPPRYMPAYFMHWVGGYDSNYSSYVRSEVLDADCESWFKEHGGLKRENGMRFRNEVLARGNSRGFDVSLREFLGRETRIEPLLERKGFPIAQQQN